MRESDFHTIVIPSRPQPDVIVAIFLLRAFGREKYPGISKAKIEVTNTLPERPEILSKEGSLLLDIGGGKFDHHASRQKVTASWLVAQDLGIAEDQALAKLLSYAERDDKYGLGTISSDAIDKAFGLSGLIASLNKCLPESPQKVVEYALPLIIAHYQEEKHRLYDLPKQFQELLEAGKAEMFEVDQKKKKLKVVAIESADPSLAGFLRSSQGAKADVVVQRTVAGYVNILTRPLKRVDLRWLAAFIRNEEAALRGLKLKAFVYELMRPGKMPEVPEWYYDLATNSLQNGGILPQGTRPTAISWEKIKELVNEGLKQLPPEDRRPKISLTNQAHSYFLEVRLPPEKASEIKEMLSQVPAGIKLHLPENYHLTLIYLGDYQLTEIKGVVEKLGILLGQIPSFEITVDGKNFKVGEISGYSTKAFYFAIGEKEGGKKLGEIRQLLEKNLPRFEPQEFLPHLTVASAAANINEKVIEEAGMELKKKGKVSFPIKKIRLTQIERQATGKTSYRAYYQFPLG